MTPIRLIIASAMLIPAAIMAQDTTPQAAGYHLPAADTSETIITMADIALMPESGVTDMGEGIYTMPYSLEIPEELTFSIKGIKALKMADGVFLQIDGAADFDATSAGTLPDNRITITRTDESAHPAGIRMCNDTDSHVTFRNIDFEYTQLANVGTMGFDVLGCTFTHAGSALNSSGAISVGCDDAMFDIIDCTFTECEVPAIGCPANQAVGLTIENCTFIDNNTSNTNKPQLNLTVGGDHDLVISNCKLIGTGRDKVGGIAVGNLTVMSGTNSVYISGCSITGHRYGITGVGPMYMEIRDNYLVDNCYETNAMNGGSGISLAGYGYGLDAIISGNHIEKSLWGVTLIQCRDVNMGEVGNPASPGGNTFKDNGNGGTPYDLYNNQSANVYAQLNTWSVEEQTAEQIEQVIFHRYDDDKLGEVIYMPSAEGASVSDITTDSGIRVCGNAVTSPNPLSIYSTDGVQVMSAGKSIDLSALPSGVYIVTDGTHRLKIRR